MCRGLQSSAFGKPHQIGNWDVLPNTMRDTADANLRYATCVQAFFAREGGGFGASLVMRELQRKLSIARGERPAERLFKNANLVNVLSGEIYRTHVAVDDGRVVGVGRLQSKADH